MTSWRKIFLIEGACSVVQLLPGPWPYPRPRPSPSRAPSAARLTGSPPRRHHHCRRGLPQFICYCQRPRYSLVPHPRGEDYRRPPRRLGAPRRAELDQVLRQSGPPRLRQHAHLALLPILRVHQHPRTRRLALPADSLARDEPALLDRRGSAPVGAAVRCRLLLDHVSFFLLPGSQGVGGLSGPRRSADARESALSLQS